ncbi:MAG TPA: YigZ family protein [Flavisolibacter sp.]|jgi:uncharacterized YigZ family protein|nr:YigZ family protein [Flavisolibacter sp.]
MSYQYNTIEKPSFTEYKDRGSRFLAFAFPIETSDIFKARLKEIKEEHPKAAHHCFAYRIGTDGNNYRSSDDGEPSGTAGKPILGQIDSKGLTNMAVVVVRYFGGTLLGVPGLINAYKTSTSLALQLTPIIQRHILVNYILDFEYNLMNEVMMILKKFNCQVFENQMQLFCKIKTGVPKENVEQWLVKMTELHAVEVSTANN